MAEIKQGITDLDAQHIDQDLAENYKLLYQISVTAFESVKDNYRAKLLKKRTKSGTTF